MPAAGGVAGGAHGKAVAQDRTAVPAAPLLPNGGLSKEREQDGKE